MTLSGFFHQINIFNNMFHEKQQKLNSTDLIF